jgi:general stress protein 26
MTAAPPTRAAPKSGTPTARSVVREIKKHSYCVLATADAKGRPHAVGVLYAYADGRLYVATGEETKKARNVRANENVSVCVPVRKYPIGPPFAVNFQGTAEIRTKDDPDIARLLEGKKLRKIVGYGVLDEPDLCFIRITPDRKLHTYGLGVPLRELLRAPAHADRTINLD